MHDPLHFHTSYEILYVHDGEIEVVIDKSVYHPVKGELVLIPPDKAHSYRTADYSVVSIGIFNTDYLSEIREEIRSGILRYPVIPNAEKLFEELLMDEEGLKQTDNKLIHIGKPIALDEATFFEELEALRITAEKGGDVIPLLQKIAPTFRVKTHA